MIERLTAQLGHDAGRMPQPHGPFAVSQQSLEEIVDRHVARPAGQHFLAAAHGPANQLDDGRRLAGPRRAMHKGHVAGRQGELHGGELAGVQAQRRAPAPQLEFGEFRLPLAQQHVAQLGQPIAAGPNGPLERHPLTLTGDFVARQIEPPDFDILGVVRQLRQGDRDRRPRERS